MPKFSEATLNSWRKPASETEEQKISNALQLYTFRTKDAICAEIEEGSSKLLTPQGVFKIYLIILNNIVIKEVKKMFGYLYFNSVSPY